MSDLGWPRLISVIVLCARDAAHGNGFGAACGGACAASHRARGYDIDEDESKHALALEEQYICTGGAQGTPCTQLRVPPSAPEAPEENLVF